MLELLRDQLLILRHCDLLIFSYNVFATRASCIDCLREAIGGKYIVEWADQIFMYYTSNILFG